MGAIKLVGLGGVLWWARLARDSSGSSKAGSGRPRSAQATALLGIAWACCNAGCAGDPSPSPQAAKPGATPTAQAPRQSPEPALASADSAAYQAAEKAGTLDAYRGYLKKHPAGRHSAQASGAVQRLLVEQEARDAAAAMQSKSYHALAQYLERHPDGANAPAVRARMEKFERVVYPAAIEVPYRALGWSEPVDGAAAKKRSDSHGLNFAARIEDGGAQIVLGSKGMVIVVRAGETLPGIDADLSVAPGTTMTCMGGTGSGALEFRASGAPGPLMRNFMVLLPVGSAFSVKNLTWRLEDGAPLPPGVVESAPRVLIADDAVAELTPTGLLLRAGAVAYRAPS